MSLLESIGTIFSENWVNRKRLFRLAIYELKSKNGKYKLGFLWNFLNPAFQVLVYWFVFSVGLRMGQPVNGVQYIYWLILGIIPWFFINNAVNAANNSVIGFSGVLKRMSFPMAIVPAKAVLASVISHFMEMAIVFIIYFACGVHISSNVWQLPYYVFAASFFLWSYSLVGSSINVIFRDYGNLFSVFMRMMYFISPVMWQPKDDSLIMKIIMMVNPFAYLINGYRNAILYHEPLMASFENGIVFWIITITMFIVGCLLHMRLRHKFIDLL